LPLLADLLKGQERVQCFRYFDSFRRRAVTILEQTDQDSRNGECSAVHGVYELALVLFSQVIYVQSARLVARAV